jgi:hypothetical protein
LLSGTGGTEQREQQPEENVGIHINAKVMLRTVMREKGR